jgi:hypothetical protein
VRTLVLALAALVLAAPAFAHEGRDSAAEDAARGLQYDGLVPAREDGPCQGVGYEFTAGGTVGCTHGPDPAPAGVDVRESPSLEELRASTDAAAPLPCVGDGVSGPRVQALYAYESGGMNRFSSVEPLIQGWASEVGDIVRSSAFGAREVRFVTDPGCRADVRAVAVSSAALGSFDTMIDELESKGYSRTDRKYLVWAEATMYCGIAGMYPDNRSAGINRNNGNGFPALFARVDSRCWAGTPPTHELIHTLGGVQGGSPNASAYGHCTDEYDVMCYADGAGTTLRYVCLPQDTYARRLDCNGDDYFNVSPTAGSWLSVHWNTANSAWLEGAAPAARPDAPAGLRLVEAAVSRLVIEWNAVSGASGYRVYLDGSPTWTGTDTRLDLNNLPCDRLYTIGVETLGAGGAFSSRTAINAATLGCPDRQVPVVTVRAAAGKRGTIVRLRYGAVDSAGRTREWIAVFRGRTRLKAFATGFANRAGGASVRWRIPRTGRGPLRFCVVAGDAAGNSSATRCAPIRLT